MYKRRDDRKFDSRMISFRRVAKVTSGAKRLRFSALVVSGDRKGKVGLGLGRGADVRQAVEKGSRKAEKDMTKIELIGDTVPHAVTKKFKAAKLVVKPAKPGTGVICATSIRSIIELAGIENVYVKQLGTNEPIANAYCLMQILRSMRADRVLKRSEKMKERIETKKEMDKERKKRERRAREASSKDKKGDKGSRGRNQNKAVKKPVKGAEPKNGGVDSKKKSEEAKSSKVKKVKKEKKEVVENEKKDTVKEAKKENK